MADPGAVVHMGRCHRLTAEFLKRIGGLTGGSRAPDRTKALAAVRRFDLGKLHGGNRSSRIEITGHMVAVKYREPVGDRLLDMRVLRQKRSPDARLPDTVFCLHKVIAVLPLDAELPLGDHAVFLCKDLGDPVLLNYHCNIAAHTTVDADTLYLFFLYSFCHLGAPLMENI